LCSLWENVTRVCSMPKVYYCLSLFSACHNFSDDKVCDE
jgi:hypothetical protein